MKKTVTMSKPVIQEMIERGLNRPMIAKELGVPAKLVGEAFKRWDLKVKRTSNAVIWDDGDITENTNSNPESLGSGVTTVNPIPTTNSAQTVITNLRAPQTPPIPVAAEIDDEVAF